MLVTFFGTRGSSPVSGPDSAKYGGNTTCLRIESESLPPDHWLVVDAGTGFVPLSDAALKTGVKSLTVLNTHYHPDHTQGALMSSLVHRKVVQLNWYGPQENGTGPLQMLQTEMKPPRFPVSFAEVASHFTCKGIEHPSGKVIVIHPEGGLKLLTVEELERIEAASIPQVAMHKARYHLGGCLVIRMLRSNHPERTISFRFEERPTGRVFAFLTDHENQDGIPRALRTHLSGADVLVMDSQYTREAYDNATAGFGHGTPDFCARVAHLVGAKRLGLTHHDPGASDAVVDQNLECARAYLAEHGNGLTVFACEDYQTVEV